MSIIDTDNFESREAKLRWAMLTLARMRGQGNFVGCAVLADAAKDDNGQPCDTDSMATRLIDDLLTWGLLEEERNPHGSDGVKRSIRHRRVKLSDKGYKLYMGDIPPHAGVWDSRLEG